MKAIFITLAIVLSFVCTYAQTAPNIFPGTGYAGIGTTAPAAPLHIYNGMQQLQFGTGVCNSGYTLSVGVNDDGVNFSSNSGVRGFNFKNGNGQLLSISWEGNVAIGSPNPKGYKLAVAGTIGARRVKVTQESWADFVFHPDYPLPALPDIAGYIEKNAHLPGIPTEKEVKENGVDLGEMNKLLLQKVEEQMLYIIQLNKQVQELSQQVKRLEK